MLGTPGTHADPTERRPARTIIQRQQSAKPPNYEDHSRCHPEPPIPHLGRLAIKFKRASQSFHNVNATANDEDLTFLGDLLATGTIAPKIQRTIGLDGIPAGIAEIGTGHTKAKIVVLPT